MWLDSYDARLRAWANLRDSDVPDPDFLAAVNQFWSMAPMINRDIHWQDQSSWPTAWELLDFSGYSELAKCLGIAYTIACSDRQHLTQESEIALLAQPHTEAHLVLVQDRKYVLNWEPRSIVNIDLSDFVARHSLPLSQLKRI